MDKIDRILAKYLSPSLNEAADGSGAGSTELWFGSWNRQPIIYVRDEIILWSPLPEFATGAHLNDSERKRALLLGYTVLDW